mmetsp:Transcript_15432/g.42531  ORF Transcript_15432/g.42531 Transcript_15432/m.42531 type:complete len:207 (-) Transcript_15432:233-853(-)
MAALKAHLLQVDGPPDLQAEHAARVGRDDALGLQGCAQQEAQRLFERADAEVDHLEALSEDLLGCGQCPQLLSVDVVRPSLQWRPLAAGPLEHHSGLVAPLPAPGVVGTQLQALVEHLQGRLDLAILAEYEAQLGMTACALIRRGSTQAGCCLRISERISHPARVHVRKGPLAIVDSVVRVCCNRLGELRNRAAPVTTGHEVIASG